MLPVAEARQRILATVVPSGRERVGLFEALDRVAAAPVRARVAVPPWDNSAMDGYAVRAVDTGPEATLQLNGVIGAGSVGARVDPGCAVAIMTGAPLPPGADAVEMIENTDGATEGQVTLRRAIEAGRNVRPAGGDVALGALVLQPGETLTPGRLGVLASVGEVDVEVARRPRVAILSTGDEIVRPGRPLGPAQIYSSNPIALCTAVVRAGGVPNDLGDAPDDLDSLVACMERGLADDVLVTTGGVSVGRFDLVKQALEVLQVPILFWKVAMKPGKPLAFGVVERDGRQIPVFGLPGNPVSCQVNFLMFVRPWIRSALGDPRPLLPELEATNLERIEERPGRTKLLRVRLERTETGWGARTTGSQSSGVGSSMGDAHGLMLREPEQGPVEVGEQVRVLVVETDFLSA